MKKPTKKIYWLSLLAAVLIVPAFAEDNANGAKPAADNENRCEAANRLNLTAEQKEKIKTIRQNQRQEMKELFQSLKEARLKIKEQLGKPETTPESIAPLAAEAKAILAKMVDKRIEGVFAVKALLTPEQFTQMKETVQDIRKDKKGCRPFWLEKRRAKWLTNQDSESGIQERK